MFLGAVGASGAAPAWDTTSLGLRCLEPRGGVTPSSLALSSPSAGGVVGVPRIELSWAATDALSGVAACRPSRTAPWARDGGLPAPDVHRATGQRTGEPGGRERHGHRRPGWPRPASAARAGRGRRRQRRDQRLADRHLRAAATPARAAARDRFRAGRLDGRLRAWRMGARSRSDPAHRMAPQRHSDRRRDDRDLRRGPRRRRRDDRLPGHRVQRGDRGRRRADRRDERGRRRGAGTGRVAPRGRDDRRAPARSRTPDDPRRGRGGAHRGRAGRRRRRGRAGDRASASRTPARRRRRGTSRSVPTDALRRRAAGARRDADGALRRRRPVRAVRARARPAAPPAPPRGAVHGLRTAGGMLRALAVSGRVGPHPASRSASAGRPGRGPAPRGRRYAATATASSCGPTAPSQAAAACRFACTRPTATAWC